MALILSIVLTLLFSSSVLYVNFENAALDQIYVTNMESLKSLDSEISLLSKTALTISNQIFRDITISKIMYYSIPDIFDMSLAFDQLNNYRLSIPFIDSIYVYNGFIHKIYVESADDRTMQSNEQDFFDPQINKIIASYRQYKPYKPVPRIYTDNAGLTRYLYTFLMYDYVAGGDKLQNGIFVNISEDWISNAINDPQASKGSNTFIINEKGISVSHNNSFEMMKDYSGESYIKKILESSTQGYFPDTVNGVKSLVVYTDKDVYGWRFVRIIPWTAIFAGVESIRTVTLVICGGILILGVLLSLLVSSRVFNPIKKIITNMETLENEKRDNERVLKNELLRNLAEGRDLSGKGSIRTEFGKLGICLDFDSSVLAILLRLDNYHAFIQNNNIKDRNLLKFAIINLSSEIFGECFRTEAVDMGGDGILLILGRSNQDEADLIGMISSRLESVKALLREHFNLSVSASLSTEGSSIEELNLLYAKLLETSLYRLYYGHGCIISTGSIQDFNSGEYNYPAQKEKFLIDALMAGKKLEIRRIYDEIICETVKYPITEFNLTISHLIFTINKAVKIRMSNNSLQELKYTAPTMFLNSIETIDEINEQFYKLFDAITDSVEEKKSSKYEDLINKIDSMISADYWKFELSTDGIANALNMSVPHLCRIYKQHTLHTIQERISDVRMEKARELLLKTEHSIVEISEKVGYLNSNYFYKAFKMSNGVTPKEYRNNMKQ